MDDLQKEAEKSYKALPCHRFVSIPLGITVIAFLTLPIQFLMFIFLGFTAGIVAVWSLFMMNCKKMGERSRNAFRFGEGFAACVPFINGYTGWFMLTNLLCIVSIPFFLTVYPIYGAFHAVKIMGKQCFEESDMAEEARPDKGGFFANAIDRAGWTDTEKEKFAEWFGEGYFGYLTLVVGDWFTVTGMIEGFKVFMEGYEFHHGILDTMASLVSSFDWLEGFGIKDYVEFDLVPMNLLGNALRKAVSVQYDIYAAKKGFKSWSEWTSKSSLKKYRGCMGNFYAVVGIIIATILYVVVLCVALA